MKMGQLWVHSEINFEENLIFRNILYEQFATESFQFTIGK